MRVRHGIGCEHRFDAGDLGARVSAIHRTYRRWRARPDRALALLILVVDDEPDVEALFRQQFRRDLRAARFMMDFARSAVQALEIVAEVQPSLILILSDVNMPGMSGPDLLLKARQARPRRAGLS
jgi:response regulator RpfG family c-di-GMP phosphodiesterase